jgi:DNA-binding CsgD family transcriptional regulator
MIDHHADGDALERLSAREREVLKLVVEGSRSSRVALGVEHLPALVKFAIRRGLTSA